MVWETQDLMRDGVAMGNLTAEVAFELLVAIADCGRGVSLPASVKALR